MDSNNTTIATFDLTEHWGLIQSSVYGTVLLLGVATNIWLVRSLSKGFKAQNTMFTRWAVNNLCIADFLYLMWVPLLILKIERGAWDWGSFLCKSYFYVSNVAEYTTVLLLTMLCFDRYMAVCHPVASMQAHKKVVYGYAALLPWLVTAILMLPFIFYSSVQPERENYNGSTSLSSQCGFYGVGAGVEARRVFILLTFAFGFVLPLLIMWSLYSLTLYHIWFGRGSTFRNNRPTNIRLTRIVLSVLIAYTCCYGPAWVFNLLIEFYYFPTLICLKQWFYYCAFIVYSMKYVNSALNPILFSPLRQNFREEILQNLQSRILRRKVAYDHSNDCNGVPLLPMTKSTRTTAPSEREPLLIPMVVLRK